MQLCLNGPNNVANPIMFCVRRAAAAPNPRAVKANNTAVVGMLCSKNPGPHVQVSATTDRNQDTGRTRQTPPPPVDSGAKQEVCSAPPQEVPREGLIERRGTIQAEPLECWDLL